MGVDVTSYIGYGTFIDLNEAELSPLAKRFQEFVDSLRGLETEDGDQYELYFDENWIYINNTNYYTEDGKWFIGVYLTRFGDDGYGDDAIELNDCFIKGIPKIARFLEWYNAQPWAIPNLEFKLYGIQVWS